MLQSTSEYEERNFDDIQRALDIEHTVKALESQLCYDQHSPEEVARQILKAACKFYDADWCGLIQVDLDLKIWTPFWWYNDSSEDAGRASIYINKELQRVDVASLNALENKNVITRFPSLNSRCTTVQVLKSPKTDSSIRTIFLPKTVAEMLVEYKAEQDMTKEALGAEYADYNLVVAGPLGMPTEQSTINGALKQLIEENDLPKVVFHSFRHSSITYKLKLNGGDIKSVQGDSGHAQASMVTEQYAHILDDDRRLNAQRFDDFFYQHQGAEPEMPHQTAQPIPENSAVDADAAAALTKLLANPSMAELIKNLAKNL